MWRGSRLLYSRRSWSCACSRRSACSRSACSRSACSRSAGSRSACSRWSAYSLSDRNFARHRLHAPRSGDWSSGVMNLLPSCRRFGSNAGFGLIQKIRFGSDTGCGFIQRRRFASGLRSIDCWRADCRHRWLDWRCRRVLTERIEND